MSSNRFLFPATLFVTLCLAAALHAQSTALTNTNVVHLVAMHVSDQTVIAVIREAKATQFDFSPRGLTELAGLSPAVVVAMHESSVSASIPPKGPSAAVPATTAVRPKTITEAAAESSRTTHDWPVSPNSGGGATASGSPLTMPRSTETPPPSTSEVPLVLDGWDYAFKPGANSVDDSYTISLKLRNVGTKVIKLVDASVSFTDLLGQSLYGVRISPDVYIAVGATHMDAGSYHINNYIPAQVRMRNLKVSDVKATLTVRRVVFSDDTIFAR